MAKNRSTAQKRQREHQKREREQRKAEKAAQKRERRLNRTQEDGQLPNLEDDASVAPTTQVSGADE